MKLNNKLQPLLIAIQFLSSIPVGKMPMPKEQDIGASLTYYPLVGVGLGLLLSVSALILMSVFESTLSAAILLAIWVYLTGALHIDGLADCADAWIGGLGSKQRTLALMKDPTSGPFAIIVLILVMLIKYTAIEALLSMPWVQQSYYLVFILPLVLSRMSAMILFATTPYARKSGLGKAISEHLSNNAVWLVSCVVLLLTSLMLRWQLLPVMLLGSVGFLYLRSLMLRRIDGCTGDTAGALIELTEVLILLGLLISIGQVL